MNKINLNKNNFDQLLVELLGHYSIRIYKEFNKRNIFFIPLKGTEFAKKYYLNPNDRTTKDIDILINYKDFSIGEAILNELGFKETSQRGLLQKKLDHFIMHSQEFVHKSNGLNVDLHFKLSERYIISPKFTREFISSARKKEFTDYYFYYPKPEHHFIFLLIQAFKNNFSNKYIEDLKQLHNKEELNFKEVETLADKYGVRLILIYFKEKYFDNQNSVTTPRSEIKSYFYFFKREKLFQTILFRYFIPYSRDWNFCNIRYLRFFIFPVYFIIKPIKTLLKSIIVFLPNQKS